MKSVWELFKIKNNIFLGIDFGSASIKAVELSYDNDRTHLKNYGWIDLKMEQKKDDNNLNISVSLDLKNKQEVLKESLAALLSAMKPESKSVYASMAGASGLVALIDLPYMDKEDLDKAIQYEAHKYIPLPLEEVYLSWDIVSRIKDEKEGLLSIYKEKNKSSSGSSKNKKNMQVLLVAAPKDEVRNYEDLITSLGLKMTSLELSMFASARSLVGDDLGGYVIIDIGADTTDIILVERGVVKINRIIDVGGNEITKAIASSMNISWQRAESFKRQKKDIIFSQNTQLIIPALELIAGETLRTIESYRQKSFNDFRVDEVILSGGGSNLTGIDKYFSESLNIPTKLGDPWKGIKVDKSIEKKIKDHSASLAVAIGLAQKGVRDFQRN